MTHLDLFSGIGGFAYAVDQVWGDVEHTFVEFDPFCQQVLKKHWPEAQIHGDIRQFNTNPASKRLERGAGSVKRRKDAGLASNIDILTGGFPCQPFSAAGLRRGTSDERHLWPEMLRVIRLTQPTWVIAENVRGILTLGGGLVFEQVCADLEASGYEVQPFIIPAVAVNAPHKRDRVWFIANRADKRLAKREQPRETSPQKKSRTGLVGGTADPDADDTNTSSPGLERRCEERNGYGRQFHRNGGYQRPDWGQDWLEVATQFCSVDDGLPVELGEFKLSKPQHRKEQLKAYGNAIVPEVALEIMRGMVV